MAEEIETLIGRQAVIYDQMKVFVDNWNKDEERSDGYVATRIEGWNDLWVQYSENHQNLRLNATAADLEKPYFKGSYAKVEHYYYSTKGILSEILRKTRKAANDRQPPPAAKKNTECKLPVLETPKFNGNFLDWPSFADLFTTTIANNAELSNAQKLQYLKASLIDEASRILRTVKVTDDNYVHAWKMLEDRYNNKSALVQAQIHALFTQPKATNTSGVKLLHDTTLDCLQSLANLDIQTENWDTILVYLIHERLPSASQNLWKQVRFGKKEVPTWAEMKEFMQSCFVSVESDTSKQPTSSNSNVQRHPYKRAQAMHTSSSPFSAPCKMKNCSEKHPIRMCPIFIKLTIPERIEQARQLGMCLNCLSPSHRTGQCTSENRCSTCAKKHHTLLHLSTEASATNANTVTCHHFQKSVSILLATAIINVKSSCGIVHQMRALIDSGSQTSFITERAVQKLNLKKIPNRTQVYGLGRVDAGISAGIVNLSIGTQHDDSIELQMEALVMPHLSDLLPSSKININAWKHVTGIQLADPEFFVPKNIDLLLGANIYSSIIMEGVKIGERGTPLAQRTIFGWILTGPTNVINTYANETFTLHQQTNIDEQLRKFIECEELSSERKLTQEEIECEEYFRQTYERDATGRYVVSLPFKTNISIPLLGDSYQSALSRFTGLERRLQRNPQFAIDYAKCIDEYIRLGHMNLTDSSNVTKIENYLAHQAVIKLSSNTTKLRVVFDASNKTSNGRSLNDVLMVGPRLQQDLAFILLRWRKHKYVLSADIEKMYRQVLVNPKHRSFQCILWRNHQNQQIQTYQMNRVTFGITSAQYLSVRAMQQLAEDEESKYPIAAAVAKEDFYVDDLFTGAATYEAATELQTQLTKLLDSGGFPLRQWSSNCSKLMANVPIEHRENKSLDFDEDAIIKTLGVNWAPKEDRFVFRVVLPSSIHVPTKRSILSDIAKIYDPPGWLAPVIIAAKMLMKKLWLIQKKWDDPLPNEINVFWQEFRNKLKAIEEISIPRWVNYDDSSIHRELHGFCDASESGYAAVIYTRFVDSCGTVKVNLLIAKTRVSPLKPVSLPRLELCGAVLLARLMKRVRDSMKIEWTSLHAWCDSQIALTWIEGVPHGWKTYVANRVVEIHENFNGGNWHYIRSAQNPADGASRGIDPTQMKELTLWWNGPSWLRLDERNWPIDKFNFNRITGEERKQTVALFNLTDTDQRLYSIIENHSSILKIFRIFAYFNRFIHNCRTKKQEERRKGPLQGTDTALARKTCLQLVQRQAFGREIQDLRAETPTIHKKSPLRRLNPIWVEDEQLIRVNGRLTNAPISDDEKYPIILPKNNKFTTLYVRHIHESTLHGGTQMVLAFIRRKYWIIDGRNTIRHLIGKCSKCFRFRAERATQLMANLPAPRVNFERCFKHTGVDFAGPIELRVASGRNRCKLKGYFALFVCLSSKAVHLEAVSGLSTDHFMAAFDRFISRRGEPSDMYSDRGTNFVGAKREITKELNQCISQVSKEAAENLSNREINWHLNPPSSPHFGGLWETGVKSVKYHLRRTFGNKVFTYEELSTALCQVEACLNSRPLCPFTNDPDDLNFISPAFLLNIHTNLTRPEPSLLHLNENRLDRWQHIKFAAQNFWKQYGREYMSRMQQRPKWHTSTNNMKIGDMVLLCDESANPMKWPIARIIDVHPGSDNLVRVVTIRTKNGIYKRPIAKLALLPIEDNHYVSSINRNEDNE